MKPHPSQVISIPIHAPAAGVYAFVLNAENMPQWMTSFVRSVQPEGDHWSADTTAGRMVFRFVPRNEFGVLDHWVKLPSGTEVLNPMRVIPNGAGCEVMFTIFQLPDTTAEVFAADAAAVTRDLQTLKAVLERQQADKRSVEQTLIEHENETWRLIKQQDLAGFAS